MTISNDEYKRRVEETVAEAKQEVKKVLSDIFIDPVQSLDEMNRETTVGILMRRGWTKAEAEAINDAPIDSPLAKITMASPVVHFLD